MDFLRAAAAAYLNDQRFSDFTIKCEGREWKVHRCFICAQSKYFEKCCAGGFAEATDREVTLKDDDPADIDRMIRYFYTFEYDDSASAPAREGEIAGTERKSSSLAINAGVYAMAEKYDVPGLKALALEKFKRSLVLSLQGQLSGYLSTIESVYTDLPLADSDRALHSLLVDSWIMCSTEILARVTPEQITTLATTVPAFSADLMTRYLKGSNDKMRTICSVCNRPTTHPRKMWSEGGKCDRCGRMAVIPVVTAESNVDVSRFW